MIDWSLLLDLLSHLVITGLISFILFKRYREIKLIFISFMTGVLVDLDHLFDYFFWKRIAAYNLKEFFNPGLYVKATQKVFCPLHGWEYLVILFFLRTIFNRRGKKTIPGFWWAVVLPYFFHLVIDQSHFWSQPFSYFLLYRVFNNFSLGAFNGQSH